MFAAPPKDIIIVKDPCVPSPCGPHSMCRTIGSTYTCSCLPIYIGSPPNCRPECTINSDCPSNLACINQICQDPCSGSCGLNAKCNVINHTPICACYEGYEGDPFQKCRVKPPSKTTSISYYNCFSPKIYF